MINCKITSDDGSELNLSGQSMNEVVDKIKDWQDWDTNRKMYESLELSSEKIQSFKTGWFYYPEQTDLDKILAYAEWKADYDRNVAPTKVLRDKGQAMYDKIKEAR